MCKAMYKVAELELSETKRVVAYYDETSYSIEDVTGEGLKLQPLRVASRVDSELLSTKDGHAANVARLVSAFHYHNNPRNYQELQERAVSLYFATAGVPHKFVSLNNGSTWADVVIYDDEDGGEWVLNKDSEAALKAWFNGEIYSVEIEELIIYTDLKTGNLFENWETVDGLGCCVIEDLTLETVKDLFGPHVLELQAA